MHFDESFWVAAALFVFIGMIIRPVGRFIVRALDSRAETISSEIDSAVQLKDEAQALLSSYQRKQRKAAEESEAIVAHAKQEAARIIKQAETQLEEEVRRATEAALEKITQTETQVVNQIRENAVDITIGVARNLIMENLSHDAAEALIDRAIADIDRTFH